MDLPKLASDDRPVSAQARKRGQVPLTLPGLTSCALLPSTEPTPRVGGRLQRGE